MLGVIFVLKKILCLFLALSMILLLSLSAFASDSRSGESWSITFSGGSSIYTGNLWSTQNDFSTDTPVFTGSGYSAPPDGYTLIGYASRGEDARSRSLKYYIYAPVGTQKLCTYFTGSDTDIHINDSFSSGDLFILYNICTSSSTNGSTVYTGYSSNRNWNSYYKLVSFVPFADRDGNIITPPDYLSCELNVLISTHYLYFNTHVNGDFSGEVQYYVFPSSVDLSLNSTLVSSGNSAYFTDSNSNVSQSLIARGFKWYVDKQLQVLNFYGIYDTSNSVDYSLYYSSSSFTAVFNPSQLSPVYQFLGSAVPDKSLLLDLKSCGRTGVFAQDSLCLVAVCQNGSSYSYSRYDFNVASIINQSGTILPNTHINPTFPAPEPEVNDLQDLADYLKNLTNLNNQNNAIHDRNFIAMLNAIPWSNFVTGGFVNGLPNLSFMLDSLFDSLFDKFTAPTQDQIDAILADINTERTSLRAKLAFVDDVKTEYYFVISTITADDNSVPPDFEFSLPSIWSNGQDIRVKLISYEIATPEIMANIKQVITVFLSLALLLHIWRTLPATVGNMPRGDD